MCVLPLRCDCTARVSVAAYRRRAVSCVEPLVPYTVYASVCHTLQMYPCRGTPVFLTCIAHAPARSICTVPPERLPIGHGAGAWDELLSSRGLRAHRSPCPRRVADPVANGLALTGSVVASPLPSVSFFLSAHAGVLVASAPPAHAA